MLLTIPAAVSCAAAAVGFLFGLGALGLSRSPGLRAPRWIGVAAIAASTYAVCSAVTTMSLSLDARAFFGRFAVMAVSVLISCWFLFAAAEQGRHLERWERIAVAFILASGAAWLIPDLFRSHELAVREVPWLGVTYTTTRPTALGRASYAVLTATVLIPAVQFFRAWRRGEPGAFASFLGVSVQLAAGVNDAFAAAGGLRTPYLLDVAQVVVVIALGSRLVAGIVESARALDRSSTELRAMQAELLRRERLAALGELSAVVAHEVRNPVAVIFNALAVLRKKSALPDDTVALLQIVNEEATRLKRVVDDLLEFARPRSLSLEVVPPGRVLERAAEAAAIGNDAAQDIELTIEEELPRISCDPHLLTQAIINLLVNALQAVGRTRPVHARAAADRSTGFVSFSVYNDGAGLTEEVASKMFTPFFTTRPAGTGLGLSIVKRVVEAHHGEIAWHHGDGHGQDGGVTFTLRVPIEAHSSMRVLAAGDKRA